jgi:hypothetical protein
MRVDDVDPVAANGKANAAAAAVVATMRNPRGSDLWKVVKRVL